LRPKLEGHTKPFFSTQGLESSWIPFGGEFITNRGPKEVPLTCRLFNHYRWPIHLPWSIPGENCDHVYLCSSGKQV
jgi:hypothetical protein